MSDSTIATRRVALSTIWFTCVICGSLLHSWKALFHTSGQFHLPVHFAVFAISGFVVFGFTPSFSRRVLGCISLIGLAFTLEALQRAIYRISFEWRDFIADTLGAAVALLLVAIGL